MRFIFDEDSQNFGCQTPPAAPPEQTRQVGQPEEALTIYLEDYVYAYLKELAQGDREHLAVLVGREVAGATPSLCISGAIRGRYTQTVNGLECFTPETWADVERQLSQSFPGQAVVGWMHSQPGFGTFLAARDEAFHHSRFSGARQVLFLRDPAEDSDAFFINDPQTGALRQARGYFLYLTDTPSAEAYATGRLPGADPPPPEPRPDAAPRIRRILRSKEEHRQRTELRFTLLAAVSGVLCLACLSLSLTAYTNQGRLRQLEEGVAAAYSLAQEARTETRAVFASQNAAGEADEAGAGQTAGDALAGSGAIPILAGPEGARTGDPAADASDGNAATPDSGPESQPAESPASLGEPDAASPAQPVFYTVQEGDTLTRISWKFFGSGEKVDEIMALNGLTDPDTIYYGRTLQLPQP